MNYLINYKKERRRIFYFLRFHFKEEFVDGFVVYGLSVCSIILLSFFSNYHSLQKSDNKIIENKIEKNITFDKNVFNDLKIEADAYVVYDILTNNIIVSKNENKELPLASITKIMTAISATNSSKNEELIKIDKNKLNISDFGLKNNQVWTLEELLKYTLIFSSNDGAHIIADHFGGINNFVSQMNKDASSLGLNLKFTDPAGLDVDNKIGGLGTAKDVAILFKYAKEKIPDLLDSTTKKRYNFLLDKGGDVRGIPNTNQHVDSIVGIEASKTGYTDKAGGNLGVVVDVILGRPVVIVVLGSSKEGRFKDVKKLHNAVKNSIIFSVTSQQ